FRIVKVEHKKGSRIVGKLNVAVTGKVKEQKSWIKTITTSGGGNWLRVMPADPLSPGEYAVVELLDAGHINLYVWDFGVDPKAPANVNAWTAKKPEGNQPEVEKRKN